MRQERELVGLDVLPSHLRKGVDVWVLVDEVQAEATKRCARGRKCPRPVRDRQLGQIAPGDSGKSGGILGDLCPGPLVGSGLCDGVFQDDTHWATASISVSSIDMARSYSSASHSFDRCR